MSAEMFVAGRFDKLCERFRSDVSARDVRLEAIGRVAGPLGNQSILDLGCGKGRFARHWLDAGASVVGLDISPGMLAQGHAFPRVRGSAVQLPFADAGFDLVVAIEVLEHLETRLLPRVLGEVHRVLAPGGLIAIVDKNARALDARRPWLPAALVKRIDEHRGRWMYRPGDPFREHWFAPAALHRLLKGSFQGVRCELLLRPEEARHRVFRRIPGTRLWALWHARKPEGRA
jgi:2-polyprenyl-6-hydroxyphenyl methylase/3-demethylubiquinone-9 3-methyltransferase